jgi:hypothetical protein
MNGPVIDLSGDDALPADTAVLHTVYPGTNKPTGWDITFAGPGHMKTVAFSLSKERERLHRAAQIERSQINGRKWKGDDDKPPEQSRRDFVGDLVARIVSWTPVNFGDGPVEFNEGDPAAEKRAVELLCKPKLGGYVAQIVEFLIDERSFMKASASN